MASKCTDRCMQCRTAVRRHPFQGYDLWLNNGANVSPYKAQFVGLAPPFLFHITLASFWMGVTEHLGRPVGAWAGEL